MRSLTEARRNERREKIFMAVWFIFAVGMIITGIMALLNYEKAIEAISTVIGIISIIAALCIFLVRAVQWRIFGEGRIIRPDGIIWIVIAFFMFNTNLLRKLGALAFIIAGIAVAAEGIRSLIAAVRSKEASSWFVPRLIFSALLIILGVYVIFNSEAIFVGMTVSILGLFFIMHGVELLIDWVGRMKYRRNFRGVE